MINARLMAQQTTPEKARLLEPGAKMARASPHLLAPERALLTEVKVVLSCVPTDVMATMITTEMSAVDEPVFMAVAPPSSWKKDTRGPDCRRRPRASPRRFRPPPG
jgi:hypothetical protein